MRASQDKLTLPGTLPLENPLPFFRDHTRHRQVDQDGTLTTGQTEKMGWELAFRVLPNRMQDFYTRRLELLTLPTAVLENEYLKAVFLPTLGGRLYSLFDKAGGRELLYVNPVLQPANLAIRNAWFSGGIEWNLGRTGHTYDTFSPVFFARCQDESNQDFWRMYSYDRCEGVCWQIDFHLPSGARTLIAHTRIVNTRPRSIPMYWWTNTAVKEAPGARVLSGTDEVLYIRPETMSTPAHAFGRAFLPDLPTMPGLDASYPERSPYANEYFFQTPPDNCFPWETIAYPEGWVFAERSTGLLRYRKMFCWGNHMGGRNWRQRLSTAGSENYLEVQAGLAPTQLHGMEMPAEAVWSFTQVFGALSLPDGVCKAPYRQAMETMRHALDGLMSEAFIARQDKRCSVLAHRQPNETVFFGEGWGALEQARRAAKREPPLPILFPVKSLSADQVPWLDLLQKNTFDMAPTDTPGLCYMTDPVWKPLLESVLSAQPEHDTALIHLGILCYENGEHERSLSLWRQALAVRPSALAARQVALALREDGRFKEALPFMAQALALLGRTVDYAYTREYAQLLMALNRFQDAHHFLSTLPDDAPDCIKILRGQAAAGAGRWEELDDDFFTRQYANIREGDNPLTDLWFEREAFRRAAAFGHPLTDTLRADVRATLQPPDNIDFRMYVK